VNKITVEKYAGTEIKQEFEEFSFSDLGENVQLGWLS